MSMLRDAEMAKQTLLGRFFEGEVVVNLDPLKKRRVKVRVFGVMDDDDPVESLPWFTVMTGVFRGASKGVGSSKVPRVGSNVLVAFDGGNVHSGIVLGEIVSGDKVPSILQKDDSVDGEIDENGTYFTVNHKTGDLEVHHFGIKTTYSKSGTTVTSSPGQGTLKHSKLLIDCPAEINGDLQVNGQIKSSGDQVAGTISQQNHTHQSSAPGNPTSVPNK